MRSPWAAAITLLIALAASVPARAAEQILRFVSNVTVERNGDLSVTETIRVEAEQNAIKHGILRDFPTTYVRPDGSRVVVGFDVQSVTLDGAGTAWSTEALANGVRVRIGSADTMLSVGEHEFVIRYLTTRQIGFFAAYDELYWNATGTGWTFPIDVAEARITLPEAMPFEQTAFYTGPQGATGKDAAIIAQQPGHIVFRTTHALPSGNGLTVAAAWPKGIVAAPDAAEQANWWLQDNFPAAVAGLGLFAILAFYGLVWLRIGRDPPRGTIIPLFGPPEGLSAAAVRYVERMKFDDRCFTAAIIDLGVNGHIRLTGTGKQTVIWRQDGGKPIAAPESAMKTKLFAAKPSVALTQSNYATLGGAKGALREVLDRSYDGKLFTDNYGWSGLGLVLVVALLVVTDVLISTTYDGARAQALIFAMWIPLLPIVGGALMIRAGRRRESWGGLMIAAGVAGIALGAGLGVVVTTLGGRGAIDLIPGIAAYILVPLALLGFHWLQAPTKAGRGVMDRIEGFRQYLGVAEEDRLNALNPPDKTPELFERFLPYAIALDVENHWAKRFSAVLAAAGTSAAAAAWYQGNNLASDPVAFTHQLSGALAQTIASASSPPGSGGGGSSSGGSSGGGGGGGGGSGW
jgi:uncharacterized membrane protein YgcG